jgi:hypothetical protein
MRVSRRARRAILSVLAATVVAVPGAPALAGSSGPAAPGIAFRLVRSNGAPASGATVFTTIPGAGHSGVTLHANVDGLVQLPVAPLTQLAHPAELAQRRVDYIVRAYAFDAAVRGPGVYAADTAYIGFVLDTLTGLVTTHPSPNGATYTMRKRSLALDSAAGSCQDLVPPDGNSYATCEQHTYFDSDLQSIHIPFVHNYGGGSDWASTLTVETSKEIQTEWMLKAGSDRWGKAEGKLTTTQTDRSSVSTPEMPQVGNVHLGKSIDQDEDWQFVRETTEICGFAGFFCNKDETVRPFEWTGGIIPHAVQVPSYPYDQAGEPGAENFNCTRRYEAGLDVSNGDDEELGTTIAFSASGGFRDEVSIEAIWSYKTTETSDLTHTYYVVAHTQPMHFLFVPGGISGDIEKEPTCPEDDIAHTYSDAADHDLTNVGGIVTVPDNPTPITPAFDGCSEGLPAQIRNLTCI